MRLVITLSITLTKELLPLLPPSGCRPASLALDNASRLLLAQHPPDHVPADARAGLLQLAHREFPDKAPDRRHDLVGLGAARRLDVAHALGEFFVRRLENEQQIIDVRLRIVLAFVPPLRALLQRLVVTRLVLLDQTLQADVTPDLIAQVITLEQQQQA